MHSLACQENSKKPRGFFVAGRRAPRNRREIGRFNLPLLARVSGNSPGTRAKNMLLRAAGAILCDSWTRRASGQRCFCASSVPLFSVPCLQKTTAPCIAPHARFQVSHASETNTPSDSQSTRTHHFADSCLGGQSPRAHG